VKFSKGYYYKGRTHYHWSKRYWNTKYRTWLFFDPSVRGWYYWSGNQSSYFPVNCIGDVPPSGYVLPGPGEQAEPQSAEDGECQASLGQVPPVEEPEGQAEPQE